MKTIFFVFSFLVVPFIHSQELSNKKFAQCLFQIKDAQELKNIENDIKLHPNVEVIRLDFTSQRAFIILKNTDIFTEENLISWFKNYGTTVSCIQIGVFGVDVIKPFPFKDCK